MIKKVAVLGTFATSLFILAGAILAAPPLQTATLDTPGITKTLVLPSQADNSGVISLGTALDPATGKVVEGVAFIHYKKDFTHKPNHNPPGGNGTSQCFSFLSQGAKWKTIESWLVNPANTRGLASEFVFSNLSSNIAKWEDGADGVLGNGVSIDILGNGAVTNDVLVADTVSPDNQNEVFFANISSPGAIAVTIVWGIFSGPPFARELVEWDQVYDDVDFDWSSVGEGGKMDFENIATHEIGHSDGMGHPDDSCTEETMYRFSSFGETKKRDLNTGDIAGINKLY